MCGCIVIFFQVSKYEIQVNSTSKISCHQIKNLNSKLISRTDAISFKSYCVYIKEEALILVSLLPGNEKINGGSGMVGSIYGIDRLVYEFCYIGI